MPRRAVTSEPPCREDVAVSHGIEDDELTKIEQRAARALAVAPSRVDTTEEYDPLGNDHPHNAAARA
jgi:hypothetical protein